MRSRPLRPAAPPDGPLATSGAAPGSAPRTADAVPKPRTPVPPETLRSSGPAPADSPPDAVAPAEPAPAATTTAPPDDATRAGDTPTGPGAPAEGTSGDTAAAPAATAEPTTAGPGPGSSPDPTPAPGTESAPAASPEPGAKPEPGAGTGSDTKAGSDTKTAPDTKTGSDSKADSEPGAGGDPKAEPDPKADSDSKTESEPKDGSGRATRRRYRVPFAHAVRLPPRQAAASAVRATRDWSKRPAGRFALSGVFLLALVSATAAAGALLVPATAPAPRPVAGSDGPDASGGPTTVPTIPGGAVPPGTPLPGAVTPGGVAPLPTGRPADALADWARVTGEKVGVPQVAMQAYGYAELVLAQTTPNCALSWTTLAAIGHVESGHGSANGAKLLPDGQALPEIIGLPLDGNGNRMRILDTDRGRLDRDLVYDRAVGPMQFIPTTWEEIGADADNDGVKNPHDLDDAALAAGNYLCKGGRKMTVPGDWWGAILSYNDVRQYAQDVFDKANEYGQKSRG
ncbi:lytic murein transglycosylase [Micromonospora echinospora]|uniref:lytic transglycosylase domain-containing protein n=1 Tax=Micromonospora echinospora TaxID=1877 RepID=UPI0037BB001E